ncbi:MAG TPA: hypothetical protein PKK06_05180 [Phycisphaerae bacterium]|nr:hypothetical protein [Phycisphaerae bacterium]
MLPTREGLFNAYPAEIGIDETGPNNLATCIVRFELYEELQPSGEWEDCADEHWELTGYFYLEKKDGALNTITIDALKAALGWDGRDPFWLQETDLSAHAVQVKLGFEEYEGKTRIKVQYLNPFGSSGGVVRKANDATRRTISNRLGSKLRALSGPAPAKPAKPAAQPKLPPAKPKAPVAAVPADQKPAAGKPAPPLAAPDPKPDSAAPTMPEPTPPPAEPPEAPRDPHAATMEEAWAEFCKQCSPPNWDQASVEAEWFRVLAELFPGKQPRELSPTEWAVMRDEGPARIVPF